MASQGRTEFEAAVAAAQRDPERASAEPIDGWTLEGQDFNGVDWSGLSFANCKFNRAALKQAKLDGATFSGCKFRLADLTEANLNGAGFLEKCDFENATLIRAQASLANFTSANLREVMAQDAVFNSAEFKNADLVDAHFEGADLRAAKNLQLNQTYVLRAQFSHNAPDPWSVLRRTYSGPRFLLSLLFPAIFIATAAAKAYGLWAISLLQRAVLPPEQANPCLASGPGCEEVAIWEIVTGWHAGLWPGLFATTSLIYNLARLFVTLAVSGMRDEEERTGRTPPLETMRAKYGVTFGYRCFSRLHWPLFCFQWLTFALAVPGWWSLLATSLIIPAGR